MCQTALKPQLLFCVFFFFFFKLKLFNFQEFSLAIANILCNMCRKFCTVLCILIKMTILCPNNWENKCWSGHVTLCCGHTALPNMLFQNLGSVATSCHMTSANVMYIAANPGPPSLTVPLAKLRPCSHLRAIICDRWKDFQSPVILGHHIYAS